MKKEKTLAEIYGEILQGRGERLSDCDVLGFKFGRGERVAHLHYALMGARIPLILFDNKMNGCAVVIVRKGGIYPAMVREIAKEYGGEEYKPKMN